MIEHNVAEVMTIMTSSTEAHRLLEAALTAAKADDFALARHNMQAADVALTEANNAQTTLLTREARGQTVPMTLLLIHAQDHLMSTVTYRDAVSELVTLYQKINGLLAQKLSE
ncbi:PTS lactose/cellobiose transporter subunit IIA [Loigolactobacillus zhaoyuanensis]|uniref:PTS lactose/cellobiose transporter subunit IIA n=1 Tax=Loigolactobacillus zhaoyuanensis TaxID=2486017 RepID=UPI000F7470E8|nr:PTS lactose/cellobiose transporter subunit IIA [Loigolactobacillus zhaoyuanensis]